MSQSSTAPQGTPESVTPESSHDADWRAARRRAQYVAEVRVNLIRAVAIAVFYLLHLAHYHAGQGSVWARLLGLDAPPASSVSTTPASAGPATDMGTAPVGTISRETHLAITAAALAWLMASFAIHAALAQRMFPRWLMTASTLLDLALLTLVLSISLGPGSALVAAYFLIIMMAALRLDLRLVWLAAGGAMLGYLMLLGVARWPRGLALQNELPRVARYHQAMMLAALALAGVLAGQFVRAAHRLAADLLAASQRTS